MFKRFRLAQGAELFVNSTRKFRTNLVQVFVSRPLDELYTHYAVLANVLKRGSRDYPTTIELAKRWDFLYGAEFRTAIYKLGEQHVYELSLELANERYLASPEPLLRDGLTTLAGMLTTPHTPHGEFSEAHLTQEQEALVRAINSLFNDKSTYSSVRCIEEMCQNEPYARLELGDKEEVNSITPHSLTRFYREQLPQARVWLAVTGDVEAEEVRQACEKAFAGLHLAPKSHITTQIDTTVSQVRVKHEEQDVNQGKLVLGYRTYTDCAAADYPALVMYNGILGAFPHSKLFINVREKASLAYYCTSSLLPVKGLLLVRSGIATEKYEQALSIIEQQVQDLSQGNISDDELTNTRLALANELSADRDRPAKLARAYVERLVCGADYSNEDLTSRLERVSRDDIAGVAAKIKLDTVYFLRGKE